MSDQPTNPGHSGPPNLQSDFFNRARRSGERVTIFLMNGKKLSGRIRAFDRYTILLDSGGSEEVIFKHAVSTISQSMGGRPPRTSKPKRKVKRPEGDNRDAGGPDRGKPSEQPLSHRMDLTNFSGGEGQEEGKSPAAETAAASASPAPSPTPAPTPETTPPAETTESGDSPKAEGETPAAS